MPFSFVVEDGSGLEDATSYVSVADADTYYTIDANFTATWAARTTTQKQHRLAWASRILDQKVTWKGDKYVEESGLRWPREGVYDRDGVEIANDVVPLAVVQATLEFAKFLQENDPTEGSDVDWIEFLKMDVMEMRFQKGTSQTAFPSLLSDILRGVGVLAVGGPRFVKIVKV